jgi:hypothetical protein
MQSLNMLSHVTSPASPVWAQLWEMHWFPVDTDTTLN